METQDRKWHNGLWKFYGKDSDGSMVHAAKQSILGQEAEIAELGIDGWCAPMRDEDEWSDMHWDARNYTEKEYDPHSRLPKHERKMVEAKLRNER